jgi:hypothetical protein
MKRQQEYTPLYGSVKKAIEEDKTDFEIDETVDDAADKLPPETVAGILKCRKTAKWLFIACYPVFLAFSIASGSSSGIAVVITLIALYALAIFAARYTLRLYGLMNMKYNKFAFALSVIIPPSSAYYIVGFLRDSHEYLLNTLSDEEFAKLHISF